MYAPSILTCFCDEGVTGNNNKKTTNISVESTIIEMVDMINDNNSNN